MAGDGRSSHFQYGTYRAKGLGFTLSDPAVCPALFDNPQRKLRVSSSSLQPTIRLGGIVSITPPIMAGVSGTNGRSSG